MARRNERNMRKGLLLLTGILMMVAIPCYPQDDVNLRKMTDDLLMLRKAKASNKVLNKMVLDWSASGKPKITLMDEIKRDNSHEYRGSGANQFKMNQMVTYVYSRQNTVMTSKGDYFNSTEKDIFYSAIEKSIKGKSTAEYTLSGHVGPQEFVFVSFNPNTQYTATVNGRSTKSVKGVAVIKLPKTKKEDKLTISLCNESASHESFVILNHNPQK